MSQLNIVVVSIGDGLQSPHRVLSQRSYLERNDPSSPVVKDGCGFCQTSEGVPPSPGWTLHHVRKIPSHLCVIWEAPPAAPGEDEEDEEGHGDGMC